MIDFVLIGGNKVRAVIDDNENYRMQLIKHTDYADSQYTVSISGIPIALYDVPGGYYALGVYFALSNRLTDNNESTILNGRRIPLLSLNDGTNAIAVDASADNDAYDKVVFNGMGIVVNSNRDLFVCDPYGAVEESNHLMIGGNKIRYVRMNGRNHIVVSAITDNGPSSGVLHSDHIE